MLIHSGSTRMRVSMSYFGISGPCDIFSYGEVEDYTLILLDRNNYGLIAEEDVSRFELSPNPVKQDLYVTLPNVKEASNPLELLIYWDK